MKLFKANDIHKNILSIQQVASIRCWDIMRWRSTDTDPGICVRVVGDKSEIEMRYENQYDRDRDFKNILEQLEAL